MKQQQPRIDYASGQGIVIIDADLQDPPELIPAMIEKWKQGFEVVYGKRKQRKGESAFKKRPLRLLPFSTTMTEINMPADVEIFGS